MTLNLNDVRATEFSLTAKNIYGSNNLSRNPAALRHKTT